jgi:hypothetical protein
MGAPKPHDQVIHVSPEVHAILVAHCRALRVSVKEWVSALLLATIKPVEKPAEKTTRTYQTVTIKPRETIDETPRPGPAPWELAPFWEQTLKEPKDKGSAD